MSRSRPPVRVRLDNRDLLRRERLAVPLWVSVVQVLGRGLFRVAWWLLRLAVRVWPVTVLAVAAVVVDVRYGRTTLVVAWWLSVLLVGCGLVVWRWRAPGSFAVRVAAPVRGWWRWRVRYARRWRTAMHGAGLHVVLDDVEHLPRPRRVRSTRWTDVMVVRLLPGQTPAQYGDAAEGLAHVYRALRCTVRVEAPGWVRVEFFVRDPLIALVPPLGAPVPVACSEDVERLLAGVWVGLREDLSPWLLRLRGGHVMIAGTTGAGKSSLVWAILHGLGDAIRLGYVDVIGLDPKHVELRPAVGLVDVHTDVRAMPAVLERLVGEMRDRCEQMAGASRTHRPTPTAPHRVVIVDELAVLTALADGAARKRFEQALGLLLSQGRAAGYTVIVTTVEPSKDVVRWRGLHAVRVGFRMDEDTHPDMVLGEGAHQRGAHCEQIPEDTPGVAYVRIEGTRDPIRVRAAYLSDDDIADLAVTYALGAPDPTTGDGDATVIDLRDHRPVEATPLALAGTTPEEGHSR